MISKILARRLKSVLSGLVEEVQIVFIQDRQILDGASIANEIVHWLKKSKKARSYCEVGF